MTAEAKNVVMRIIPAQKSLDPIRYITEDIEPGRGRIIVICYDRAWVAFWGAMGGGSTVAEFFLRCDPGYIAGNMLCGSGFDRTQRGSENHERYLIRIIEAIQASMREELAVPA